MEWYCAVFNSDKVSSAAGAQILYERLCEGDDSLMSTDFENAGFINDLVKKLAKKHGLSFYEPQNMVYQY